MQAEQALEPGLLTPRPWAAACHGKFSVLHCLFGPLIDKVSELRPLGRWVSPLCTTPCSHPSPTSPRAHPSLLFRPSEGRAVTQAVGSWRALQLMEGGAVLGHRGGSGEAVLKVGDYVCPFWEIASTLLVPVSMVT